MKAIRCGSCMPCSAGGEPQQARYWVELKSNSGTWNPILESIKHGNVTLLYSAHDAEHNHALTLKRFFEKNGENMR
ncbi:MAG: DUF488 family protein [Anaerolineales bacterium]|nr:DUF488 family protein [Anaerolineales bacterium]